MTLPCDVARCTGRIQSSRDKLGLWKKKPIQDCFAVRA